MSALYHHVHIYISYVESGKLKGTVGDEMRVLRTSNSFYAAPNVPHGVVTRQAGGSIRSAPCAKTFCRLLFQRALG